MCCGENNKEAQSNQCHLQNPQSRPRSDETRKVPWSYTGWQPVLEQARGRDHKKGKQHPCFLAEEYLKMHKESTLELHWLTTCPGTSTWTRPQKRQTTPLLSCGGISQDAQARSRPSATLLSSDLWLSMQLQPGTPTLPETSSSSKLSNVEQQDLSQATKSSTRQMITNLGWSSLQQRRIEARLVIMYRITHDLVDIPAAQYLHPATFMHIRGHSQRYMLPFCRTGVNRHSFFPAGIRLWNQLQSMSPPPRSCNPSWRA